jgi:hypothetical protein
VPPGQTILELLDMRRDHAEVWHRQLYAELASRRRCDGRPDART